MDTTITTSVVFICILGAAFFGMKLRRMLPEHHFSADTQDTVKLAMGFVATMAALILGLLVASAKDSYDQQASDVTQLAAKVVFLDRLLANFGSETQDVRALYRRVVDEMVKRMWPEIGSGQSQLDPSASPGEQLFIAINALKPTNDLQTTLKSQAISTSMDIGQLRWLEYEQAGSNASQSMLCILVFWTAVLFASFGMFAPRNGTVIAAMVLAALSVAGAIFLIIELRSPFSGLLQIPQTALVNALSHLGT